MQRRRDGRGALMIAPAHANVAIIGGGVIGASVAWHLTDMGCDGVVVLERGQMGCGTTWHSAGNIIRMSSDPATVSLYSYGVALMERLHARHGIGWHKCGRVMMARTRARLQEFDTIRAALDAQGVPMARIAADEVADRLPILNTDDILGALWSPEDGRVNPTDLVAAYLRDARARGAVLCERVTVDRAESNGTRVTGVHTDQGLMTCNTVINCAGLWARGIGLRNGVAIPLYPVEHFYCLTDPIAGVHADMPTFRDPDGLIYGREEVGGLLLGCFDRNAIPVRPGDLPEPFEFGLLNENWDQFEPYLKEGLHRVPALQHAGIRSLVNGPESFTPDMEPLMDRAPGFENYYVLAGLCSAGVTRSAGMGRALARWIMAGDPGMDVSAYRLARFPPGSNDEASLRAAVRHAPSGHFEVEHNA